MKYDFDITEIDKFVDVIERYIEFFENVHTLTDRLAQIGLQYADVQLTEYVAMADSVYNSVGNDVLGSNQVYLVQTNDGFKLVFTGESIWFLEYGTGVFYNGSEGYPIPRPSEVDGIGEYGQRKGNRKMWGYYEGGGNLQLTRGNPAFAFVYKTNLHIIDEVQNEIKKVFK